MVKVYVWTYCPFCIQAIRLLESKNIEFETIVLDGRDDELKKLRAKTNQRTVPQIFIGEEFIGGFDDLSALNNSGQLDKMLSDS